MNIENYKYILRAWNKQGATISFYGNNIKELLSKFDNEYNRSGFIIRLHNKYGNLFKTVKKSYR